MLIFNILDLSHNFTGTNIRKGDGIRIAPYAKCPQAAEYSAKRERAYGLADKECRSYLIT